jgi:hypothetical protein
LENVIAVNEFTSNGLKKLCFASKTCASWGTLIELTNLTPQKILK